MVSMKVVPLEEAKNTRKVKAPGARRQRMNEFDTYAQELIEHAEEAVLYQDLGENPQKFVLSLRGAFKRAKFPATVRKMRGRDEVRAWRGEQPRPAAAKPRGRRSTK